MPAPSPINSSDSGDSSSHRAHLPEALQYLRPWASKFGLRGLTVYFRRPPLGKLASEAELVELAEVYELIARRGDASTITTWCQSVERLPQANEAKHHLRGLLLLFESLAAFDLPPFTDGRVRFPTPATLQFDWNLLPPHLRQFKPWLKKFEGLSAEFDLFEYVRKANHDQLLELAELDESLDQDGPALLEWCEANNVENNPAENEAFQAEWLFLLVDFSRSRLSDMRSP